MTPFDLIAWAGAATVALAFLAVAIVIVGAAIEAVRGNRPGGTLR